MEYLNQAKANLAAMQQAVAVQAQQEQMAMLLRERISQIDQMVAEPAEPVGSTTSYLSEEDRRRFGLDPGPATTGSRGRQPAMQPAAPPMVAPGARSGAAPASADGGGCAPVAARRLRRVDSEGEFSAVVAAVGPAENKHDQTWKSRKPQNGFGAGFGMP